MFSVKAASVCPRIADRALASTPLARAWVEKVCLRSWKEMSGSPAYFSSAFMRRYAALGETGRSGFVGW